ncbi:ATP-dependent DNA helicase II subunit 2 [Tulasnella sp. 403]|nr:ATP-dependent DNA helicase II subunit 2 [Tulasnella sp. 403]
MPAERSGYTVTMFVIDVSPSMGNQRTIQLPPGPDGEAKTRTLSNLEWALQFVMLKIQDMIYNGRKTDQCGVILFGTRKTKNTVNTQHGGYDHVTEYIPIGQPTAHTLDLVSAIGPGAFEGDVLDGLIVAIQTQAEYLVRKQSWTRKITLLTDGESQLTTADWDSAVQKINELGVHFTIIGVDFDDDDYKQPDKSNRKVYFAVDNYGYVSHPHQLRIQQRKNEKFYRRIEAELDKGLLGSCYKALEDCALPEVKPVSPAGKGIMLYLGDQEARSEEAIEISAKVHKVTAKASVVSLKKYIKRGGRPGERDLDGDIQMGDLTVTGAAVKAAVYAAVDRETKYFTKPPPPSKEKAAEEEEEEEVEETERSVGEPVSSDDLVRGYKYGATWVLVEEEFERLPTKPGIEVIGFMRTNKAGCLFNRSYIMGEIYTVSADPNSARSQLALSSFVRAMHIKDVLAIVRWVHAPNAEPQMAVLAPVVELEADYLFMARLPFAEDVRNYTFRSLDNLVNTKGETATKHPFLTTDPMVSAMEKWVDKMDLMDAAVDAEGQPEPWFETCEAYNPGIHRLKQALFHAAITSDLEKDPIPPPHQELLKFMEPPEIVVERSRKSLERLKNAVDVTLVPPKPKGKKKVSEVDATVHTGDDFSVTDLLGDEGDQPLEATSSLASLTLKGKAAEKAPQRDITHEGTEDEKEKTPPPRAGGRSHLPTPGRSPTVPPPKPASSKQPPSTTTADLRRGRIIGNAFPLADFRRNLERGDVVSKALKDMAAIIPEMVEESFSTQRYDEALECMRAMRETALVEDDIGIWNQFIQDLKQRLQNKSSKNRDFWEWVQKIGMSISLITDKEADRHNGYSEFSEMQSVQPACQIVVAAKIPDHSWSTTREVKVLTMLDEFYGDGQLPQHTRRFDHYLFMKYHPGVKLWETDGWRTFVSESGGVYRDERKDHDRCIEFFQRAAHDIAQTAKDYALRIGMKNGDLHIGNVIFPERYPTVPGPLVIIDWEWADTTTDPDDAYQSAYDELSFFPFDLACKGPPTAFDQPKPIRGTQSE